jgi:hypothetical protein
MNSDVDFAVAAWHEGSTWNLEILPDPYNLSYKGITKSPDKRWCACAYCDR